MNLIPKLIPNTAFTPNTKIAVPICNFKGSVPMNECEWEEYIHLTASLHLEDGLHSYDSYVSFIRPTWPPQTTWPGSDAGFTSLQLRYNCNFGLIITIDKDICLSLFNKPCKHDQYMFQISSQNWEPDSNLLKLWEISAMAWIMYWKHWSYQSRHRKSAFRRSNKEICKTQTNYCI